MQKLLEVFKDIKSAKIHRAALWILGEYSTSISDIEAVIKEINHTIGEGPLLEAEQRLISGDTQVDISTEGSKPTTLVTSDGTYATQSAFNTAQYVLKYFFGCDKCKYVSSLIEIFYKVT